MGFNDVKLGFNFIEENALPLVFLVHIPCIDDFFYRHVTNTDDGFCI